MKDHPLGLVTPLKAGRSWTDVQGIASVIFSPLRPSHDRTSECASNARYIFKHNDGVLGGVACRSATRVVPKKSSRIKPA
jgi:hypothetical protein